jgi:hypothetical protein
MSVFGRIGYYVAVRENMTLELRSGEKHYVSFRENMTQHRHSEEQDTTSAFGRILHYVGVRTLRRTRSASPATVNIKNDSVIITASE